MTDTNAAPALVDAIALAAEFLRRHRVHFGYDDLSRWRKSGHLHVAGRNERQMVLYARDASLDVITTLMREEGRLR